MCIWSHSNILTKFPHRPPESQTALRVYSAAFLCQEKLCCEADVDHKLIVTAFKYFYAAFNLNVRAFAFRVCLSNFSLADILKNWLIHWESKWQNMIKIVVRSTIHNIMRLSQNMNYQHFSRSLCECFDHICAHLSLFLSFWSLWS